MTHLFAADVLNSKIDDLPHNWHLWDSEMGEAFTKMVENVLATITNQDSIPSHARLISSMSTNNGGLGIQHPQSTAIPAFIFSTRRVLQYTSSGVYIGKTLPPVTLPPYITCLFSEWRTSSATTFVYFRRYLDDISNICVRDTSVDDKQRTFINDSSINMCRERINDAAAELTKATIEHEWRHDQDSLDQLEDLLEPRHSKAMMDMSRLNPKNRQKNEKFGITLRRKLRLELWPGETMPICFCGKTMDQFGDHVLSCRSHCKTAMSDATRNGLTPLLKKIYSLVKLISTDACVQKETRRIVKQLPNLRPFDISVLFDPLLDETAWRTPLYQLGFDVTYIRSTPLEPSSKSKAARISDIHMRLRLGEKGKFQRRGKTDKQTGISLTGDEIVGHILKQNMGFIPIAVSPHGKTSSLWDRHMYGTPAMDCPDFAKGRTEAAAAYRLADSLKVPWGVLKRANDIWRHEHEGCSFGGSYHAMTPEAWFDQEFGLVTSSAIASHLLRAHNRNRTKSAVHCLVSDDCRCEDKLESWEAPAVSDTDRTTDNDCISISSDSGQCLAEPAVLPHS